jgi:hypothetical protein
LALLEVKNVKTIVKKFVVIAGLAVAVALSPGAFASDRFPLPHEILGIPTPHELLGIPAPHEFLLGPDRFSRYRDDNRYYRDDHRYDRPYYRPYGGSYGGSYNYYRRDDRDWSYGHHHEGHGDHGRYWRHH